MEHYSFVIVNVITCICDYCKDSNSKNQCLALFKYDVKMVIELIKLIKNKPHNGSK